MTQLTRITLGGIVAALIAAGGVSQSFAEEPGDFNATLRGATIGIPLGGAPPPGLYGGFTTFTGPNGVGQGQNAGLTVFGQAEVASLVWGTGWKFLNADVTFAVVEPFFTVGGFDPNSTIKPPIAFGDASFFENWHNTVWSGALSWNLGGGWHGSLGLNFQGPDGSQYNGTLNQDYWTVSPTWALAYFSKDWVLSANFEYDIHGASAGHTGLYQNIGFPAPGIGYKSGQQLFIDWAAEYKIGKWAIGPAGYFKFQTTDDSPGSGWTCASLAADSLPGCGSDQQIALGGIVSYNLGLADFDVIVTDSVYNKDDFSGWSVFTRLTMKLWGPEAPAAKPMVAKAH